MRRTLLESRSTILLSSTRRSPLVMPMQVVNLATARTQPLMASYTGVPRNHAEQGLRNISYAVKRMGCE